MHKYRDLKVWQRAMAFTIAVYKETRHWPDTEKFGLISQTRRAATSIPLNIAEGAGNESNKEFIRFLQFSLRSTYEVMTALEIAHGLTVVPTERLKPLLQEADQIAAMTVGLMKSLGWRKNQSK